MNQRIKIIKTTLSVVIAAAVTGSVAMVYSRSNSPYVIDSLLLPRSIEFTSDGKLIAMSSNFDFSEVDVETQSMKLQPLNTPTPRSASDMRVISVNSFAFSVQKI